MKDKLCLRCMKLVNKDNVVGLNTFTYVKDSTKHMGTYHLCADCFFEFSKKFLVLKPTAT